MNDDVKKTASLAHHPMSELETLINIPDCFAFHVHADNTTALSSGVLTLYSTGKHESPLVIAVGSAAFPLARTTPFGTLQEDCTSYVFKPAYVPGHVLLQLPHTAIDQDSHVATLQETFEAVLIKHGFLKDGLDAYADEIARSSQEAALAAAARMREGTAAYLASKPPTQYPIQVNPSIYETIDGIAEHTSSVAASTSEVADTVGSHASDAGAWLAMQSRNAALRGAQLPTLESSSSFAPTDLPLSENDESVNGAQTLSTFASMFVATTWAVSSSASAVVTAAGQSLSALVGHEFGPEVQRVANGAGASIVGASRAVGNVSQVVNPTWYGKRGVLGALDVKDPQRADEVRRDERDMRAKAHAAEETARI